MHALIRKLAAAIEPLASQETVEISGEWSSSSRKTYTNKSQLGSGSGPFVEILDHRWRGVCECSVPLAGLGFMVTPRATYWIKSPPAVLNPMVEVSFHAC